MPSHRFARLARAALVVIVVPAAPLARADHGPGTSGGGLTTETAETLKPGAVSLALQVDYTEFEDLSRSAIERKAAKAGSFDFLDRSWLTTLTASYGVVEDLEASVSLGYYDAEDAGEAEFDETTMETEFLDFDPDGVTDLWLTGKYRFSKGPAGQFAALGGVKFPTGKHDVENSAGERVEPSATAGSGAFDFMAGLAYSRWLTERFTLDASAGYTLRTEHDDFRLGDRVDAGVAIAYRLVEDLKTYPRPSVFAEANYRYLMKSEEDGHDDDDTGGNAVFLSPGFRLSFSEAFAWTIAPQFPVWQDLNGEQLETEFKVVTSVTVTF